MDDCFSILIITFPLNQHLSTQMYLILYLKSTAYISTSWCSTEKSISYNRLITVITVKGQFSYTTNITDTYVGTNFPAFVPFLKFPNIKSKSLFP